MNEVWIPVLGYEGHYEVSNLGRVRSLDRFVRTAVGGKRFQKGRILRPTIRSASYQYWCVNLALDGIHVFTPVHQIVCRAWVGPKPFDLAEVRHIDDDRDNNIAANLSWGTRLENEADKDANGKCPRGEAHHFVKDSEEEVVAILRMARSGLKQSQISVITGKPKSRIQRMVSRKTWRHINV